MRWPGSPAGRQPEQTPTRLPRQAKAVPETADATSSAAIARCRIVAPSTKPDADPLRLSVTIRSFSSSVQRRRRPVSTTSRRSTTGLDLGTAIRTVLYPLGLANKAALAGGVRPDRRPDLPQQQRRRARAARSCARSQGLAVRWLRSRWPARRLPVQPDRDGEAQRHRSASLAGRCARPHRRSSCQSHRRAAAVELDGPTIRLRSCLNTRALPASNYTAVLTACIRIARATMQPKNAVRRKTGSGFFPGFSGIATFPKVGACQEALAR